LTAASELKQYHNEARKCMFCVIIVQIGIAKAELIIIISIITTCYVLKYKVKLSLNYTVYKTLFPCSRIKIEYFFPDLSK